MTRVRRSSPAVSHTYRRPTSGDSHIPHRAMSQRYAASSRQTRYSLRAGQLAIMSSRSQAAFSAASSEAPVPPASFGNSFDPTIVKFIPI